MNVHSARTARPRLTDGRLRLSQALAITALAAMTALGAVVPTLDHGAVMAKGKAAKPVIAFSRFSPQDGEDPKIFVLPLSGEKKPKKGKPQKAKQLTRGAGWDVRPRWSPDGTTLLFIRDDNVQYDVWSVSANGKNQQNLTNTPNVNEYSAAWSPDGTQLAVIRGDDLWVMDADGTNGTQIPVATTNIDALDWAPDGSLLAFTGNGPNGYVQIWTIEPDGDALTMVTNQPGKHVGPRWSPDSSQLAFMYSGYIERMSRTGANRQAVTTGPDPTGPNLTGPAWSPDGQRLVVETNFTVGTVSVNGGKVRQIPTRDYSFGPDWRP